MTELALIADDIPASDLLNLLTEYWGLKNDAELARELTVDRRSISQYRRRESSDIQTKIIIALLRDIGYLEKKIQNAK